MAAIKGLGARMEQMEAVQGEHAAQLHDQTPPVLHLHNRASGRLVEADLLAESTALRAKCGGDVAKQACYINLSAVLQSGDVSALLMFEDGALFEMQGVDVT